MENLMTMATINDSSGAKSDCSSLGMEEIRSITTDESDEDSDLGEFLKTAGLHPPPVEQQPCEGTGWL